MSEFLLIDNVFTIKRGQFKKVLLLLEDMNKIVTEALSHNNSTISLCIFTVCKFDEDVAEVFNGDMI